MDSFAASSPSLMLSWHSILFKLFLERKKGKKKDLLLRLAAAGLHSVEAAISSGWKASTTNLVSSSNFIMKEDLENCLKNVACIFYFVRNTGCIIRLKACLEKLALLTFLIFMLGLVSTYPWQ